MAGCPHNEKTSLGIGIINFAFWLAKNGTNYQEPNLELVDEWAEAWSYYLIKASADLASEKGAIEGNKETKYGHGITPTPTYKKEVDELVPHKERMDWKGPEKTTSRDWNSKPHTDGTNAQKCPTN